MTYKSNNFKFGRNAYATSEEYQEAEAIRRQEEQDYDDSRCAHEQEVASHLAASWTARSGQKIVVYVWNGSITVEVDGESHDDCQFGNVPPAQAAAAKAVGIVAKLGPVGVTAEQKTSIEAKMGR